MVKPVIKIISHDLRYFTYVLKFSSLRTLQQKFLCLAFVTFHFFTCVLGLESGLFRYFEGDKVYLIPLIAYFAEKNDKALCIDISSRGLPI